MSRVVVVLYKPLEYLPPVMSLLMSLKGVGREVVFVGVKSEASEKFLGENGISHRYLPYDRSLYKNPTLLTKITHRIVRALRFYPCRAALRRTLADLRREAGEITLWFAEVQSAALFGDAWRDFPQRAVTIYELADFKGSAWWGFSFRTFLCETVVVEPEVNRAREIQKYFGLAERPLVVANKPSLHPRQFRGEIPQAVMELLAKVAGRPIFLYQGVWTKDRKDVGMVLETIAKNRPQYCVVAMPGSAAVQALLDRYDNFFAVDYIAPPNHLAVTSLATVGLAIYSTVGRTELVRKNALFCAPNKIYEYAGFGVPTLGNRLPGLEDTVGRARAGLCVDLQEEKILSAADELVRNHATYSQNANRFFDETDVEAQVKAVLERAEKR